ncbi:MAG: thioredoxin family protein, partial [Alistipes sp.]|nr:thioredoxin family protein [Alistipes sp.]
MKRIHLLLCLLVLAPTAWGQVRFSEGSTDKIRQLAEQQQKLVFIDLTADWCGYCRWMDSEVYAQPEVGNYMNAHFVAVRYDVDQPTGGELLKRYGNGGIPLLLIFDRQG